MKPGGIVAWINNDISYDLISITKNNANQSQSITSNNFTVNNANAVPEFGQVSYVILAFSIISVLAVSAKSSLNSKI
jgi:predicted secreted protein with PEFG-CTERM motif